jgi:hypothetical protein
VRRGDADAYTNGYLHANFDAYGDIYAYRYGNSYVHANSYGYGYGYTYSYGYSNTYGDSGCLPTNAGLLEESSQCLASEYADAGQPDIYQGGIASHIEQSG